MITKKTISTIGLLALLLLAGAAAGSGNRLLVLVNGYLRVSPELRSDPFRAVAVDDTLRFNGEKDGWYHVVDSAGVEKGWITSDVVKVLEFTLDTSLPDSTAKAAAPKPAPVPLSGTIVMQADGPMMSKPTAGTEVSGYFVKGKKLQYTGQKDGWFRILNADGTEAGFISTTMVLVDTTSPMPDLLPVARKDSSAPGQPSDSEVFAVPGLSVDSMAPPSAAMSRYVYFREGRLKVTSNGPVFDIPSTAGRFNRGVAYGEVHPFVDKQEGYFKMIGDRGDTLGWVYNTVVRVLQEPETLTFEAPDSATALAIMDSLSRSYAPDTTALAAAEDTSAQLTFMKPATGFTAMKDKAMAYAKEHKRIVIAGGGVLAGSILLAVLLSGGDSGNTGNGTAVVPPGGGPGGGNDDIPAIDVSPPSTK